MTKRIRRAASCLLAAGLLAGGATAASADGGTKYKQTRGDKVMKQKTVQGRVTAIKSVKLKGTQQRHAVALIRTQQGQQKIVDLGPRDEVRNTLNLEIGDRLWVQGKPGMVRGRTVFIADRARTADNQLMIDRSMQLEHFDREVRKAHAAGELVCPPDQG